MSEPTDGSALTPGVKKQTRRFAPVKRGGGKSPAAIKREAAAAAAAAKATESTDATNTESNNTVETATTSEASPATTSSPASSNKPIGTMRPEGSGSGRLQSVNDGQKTRGGSIKMKFKPTIPHKRNKKEVTSSAIDQALGKPAHFSERGGRGGGRGRGAGRGRGRGRGLVIVDESTASGIFSLGPSAVSRGRMGGGGGAFASYGGDLPNRTETGEEEESDMVELFTNAVGKDTPVTFRHVSQLEGDIDPVTLKQTINRIPWMTVKSTPPKKDTTVDIVKTEANDVDMDAEDKEVDKEPVVLQDEEAVVEELPKLYMDGDSPAQNIFALDEKHRLVCVAEEELLYFQLPTVVPKFEKKKVDEPMEENEDEEKLKTEENTNLPSSAKKSVLLEDAMSNLGLEDTPEGQVGTLIVYKSGKMKMKFGNILLDVNQGMQSTFLENVMVVDHESEETKKAIELGHIVQKFVCAPNMDALLTAEEEALI